MKIVAFIHFFAFAVSLKISSVSHSGYMVHFQYFKVTNLQSPEQCGLQGTDSRTWSQNHDQVCDVSDETITIDGREKPLYNSCGACFCMVQFPDAPWFSLGGQWHVMRGPWYTVWPSPYLPVLVINRDNYSYTTVTGETINAAPGRAIVCNISDHMYTGTFAPIVEVNSVLGEKCWDYSVSEVTGSRTYPNNLKVLYCDAATQTYCTESEVREARDSCTASDEDCLEVWMSWMSSRCNFFWQEENHLPVVPESMIFNREHQPSSTSDDLSRTVGETDTLCRSGCTVNDSDGTLDRIYLGNFPTTWDGRGSYRCGRRVEVTDACAKTLWDYNSDTHNCFCQTRWLWGPGRQPPAMPSEHSTTYLCTGQERTNDISCA